MPGNHCRRTARNKWLRLRPGLFFPELGKTYAELSEAEKNLYSHRARAVAALLASIEIVNRQSSIVNRYSGSLSLN